MATTGYFCQLRSLRLFSACRRRSAFKHYYLFDLFAIKNLVLMINFSPLIASYYEKKKNFEFKYHLLENNFKLMKYNLRMHLTQLSRKWWWTSLRSIKHPTARVNFKFSQHAVSWKKLNLTRAFLHRYCDITRCIFLPSFDNLYCYTIYVIRCIV